MPLSMRGNQIRLVLLAIVVVLAAIRYPAIRWFVGISVVLGFVLLPVVRWWNNRPAQVRGDDQIRLNLDNSEDQPREPRH